MNSKLHCDYINYSFFSGHIIGLYKTLKIELRERMMKKLVLEKNEDVHPGFKEMRISVITIVYNDPIGLERTIQSVVNQTYQNVEYVVIDGGSTDDTLKVIDKHKESISFWNSEKDKGIYDAMNKGIRMASNVGYMCFMNAGDVFYSPQTIEKVALSLEENESDILYGDTEASYLYGFRRRVNSLSMNQLWKGMCFSHQAMFVKSEVMKNNLYNLNNNINADYEFICKVYKNGFQFKQVDTVIALTEAGGISDARRLESVKGHWKVAREIWPGFKTDFYYFLKLLDTALRVIFHRVFPLTIRKLLTRLKYFGSTT